MVPPVWFDRERGRVPIRQCWRCVSERPIVGLRTDDFRRLGWEGFEVSVAPVGVRTHGGGRWRH